VKPADGDVELAAACCRAEPAGEGDQFGPLALDVLIAPDRADQRLGRSEPPQHRGLAGATETLPAIRRQTRAQPGEALRAAPTAAAPGGVAEIGLAHTPNRSSPARSSNPTLLLGSAHSRPDRSNPSAARRTAPPSATTPGRGSTRSLSARSAMASTCSATLRSPAPVSRARTRRRARRRHARRRPRRLRIRVRGRCLAAPSLRPRPRSRAGMRRRRSAARRSA